MIYDDLHAGFLQKLGGKASITRASHVEPAADGSGWTANMSPVGGPVLGPFPLREIALAAEVEYLETILF